MKTMQHIYLPACGKIKARSGFSLVETVMGMAVLAVLAAGTTAGVLLSQRIANSNVHENTAFTVAQGYMEQVKSMEYTLLTSANDNYIQNKATVDGYGVLANNAYLTNSTAAQIMLETKSIDASTAGTAAITNIEMDAPLYIGAQVERSVLLDIKDPGLDTQRELMMPMRFEISMTDLGNTAIDYRALEITLAYQYQVKHRGAVKWRTGQLNFVKSFAPTF